MQYTLINAIPFHKPQKEMVLLILKDRPSWQKNFLNLVGGKVEEGESDEAAALRELKEETGYVKNEVIMNPVKKLGVIEADGEVIHCFNIHINNYDEASPKGREGETEIVRWFPWELVREDCRLMASLRIILPLMISGSYGWTLHVKGTLNEQEINTVQLTYLKPNNINSSVTNIIKNGYYYDN